MALGDYNNNEQGFRPTVYGYSFYNTDNDLFKSRMQFSMWSRTIKISIEQMTRKGEDGGMNEYDSENNSVIYLNPSKAQMFGTIIERFYKNPEKYNGYGVASSRAFICIYREGNYDVIRIDKICDDGHVEEGNKYVINTRHGVISGWEGGSPVYDSELCANLDYIQIIAQLKDYAKYMNNTIAFTVADQLNYNNTWLRNALIKIAGAADVTLTSGARSSKPVSGTSQFAGSEDSGLDDLDSFLDE